MKRGMLVLAGVGLLLGACGEKEESEEGRAAQPCATTPAPIEDPQFPDGFPEIDDVTWIASQAAGPSRVVNGYTGDAIDDLFREMKEHFSEGGYSVTKSERDAHDAEVNFDGASNSGQVALADECQGRTSVRITIRPK